MLTLAGSAARTYIARSGPLEGVRAVIRRDTQSVTAGWADAARYLQEQLSSLMKVGWHAKKGAMLFRLFCLGSSECYQEIYRRSKTMPKFKFSVTMITVLVVALMATGVSAQNSKISLK